jgi:hypothetical protein
MPLPAGIVRKFWENIRNAASRRNCPKSMGKYPECRFPPELSENFGKISGMPLPAGIEVSSASRQLFPQEGKLFFRPPSLIRSFNMLPKGAGAVHDTTPIIKAQNPLELIFFKFTRAHNFQIHLIVISCFLRTKLSEV